MVELEAIIQDLMDTNNDSANIADDVRHLFLFVELCFIIETQRR